MTLKNENKIHSVILKLDKENPRELALRQFLDDATDKGINRKEAILRIFEDFNNTDPFKLQIKTNKTAEPTKKEEDNNIEEIKANKEVTDVSDFME